MTRDSSRSSAEGASSCALLPMLLLARCCLACWPEIVAGDLRSLPRSFSSCPQNGRAAVRPDALQDAHPVGEVQVLAGGPAAFALPSFICFHRLLCSLASPLRCFVGANAFRFARVLNFNRNPSPAHHHCSFSPCSSSSLPRSDSHDHGDAQLRRRHFLPAKRSVCAQRLNLHIHALNLLACPRVASASFYLH
jgi:hypothetical protein